MVEEGSVFHIQGQRVRFLAKVGPVLFLSYMVAGERRFCPRPDETASSSGSCSSDKNTRTAVHRAAHACVNQPYPGGGEMLGNVSSFPSPPLPSSPGFFFTGEENKSLSHNNNPLSCRTGLVPGHTFMLPECPEPECVTSEQLTFLLIKP